MVVVAGSSEGGSPAHVRYRYFLLSAHRAHAWRTRQSAWGPALAEVIVLHELYTPPPLLIYNGGGGGRLAQAAARTGTECRSPRHCHASVNQSRGTTGL